VSGRSWGTLAFFALMLALMGLFVVLGFWQLERLGEKEALVATVAERANLPPEPLPPVDQWTGLDPTTLDFRPLSATGHFVPDQSVAVFTSLSEPRGRYTGAGYWLMVPFVLEGGGVLFVDRGFVPQDQIDAFRNDPATPAGTVTLTGIARRPERGGSFTPDPDRDGRVDWIRNPERLGSFVDPALGPVAPFYLDLPSSGTGVLPQGGETVMEFPNRHLEYAVTWFGFAAIIPVLLGFWLFRRRREQRPASGNPA